jgi:hypothetical protein
MAWKSRVRRSRSFGLSRSDLRLGTQKVDDRMAMQHRDLRLEEGGGPLVSNSQSIAEFKNLLVRTSLSLKQSVEQSNAAEGAPRLHFSRYSTDDGRSLPCITGLENSFSLNWRLPAADSPEGLSLEATIWSGGLPSLGYPSFEKPRPQTSRALHLGCSIGHSYAWIDDDSSDEFSPEALAGELVAWYLDNGR